MSESFPWYRIVAHPDKLEQGDMIRRCPIVIPPTALSPNAKVDVHVEEYDVVVMSQSCDLQNGKLSIVLVCPFYQLGEFAAKNAQYGYPKAKEALRQGYYPGYHLLNRCEVAGFGTDFLVVDFRSAFGVAVSFLGSFAKQQVSCMRLLPPYREHLSQAFARFFMRVGLPVNIPQFK